jgi:hypothetical protein
LVLLEGIPRCGHVGGIEYVPETVCHDLADEFGCPRPEPGEFRGIV